MMKKFLLLLGSVLISIGAYFFMFGWNSKVLIVLLFPGILSILGGLGLLSKKEFDPKKSKPQIRVGIRYYHIPGEGDFKTLYLYWE